MDGTTAIKIDYYEELKAKADFVDVFVKHINNGQAKLILLGDSKKEVMDVFSKIKGNESP